MFSNDLHALVSPNARGTPLRLILLGKSKNAPFSTFLFLDQIVWLGRTGIYKNKEGSELIGRISLFFWLGSSVCTTLVEIGELGRLSASMKRLEELKNTNKHKVTELSFRNRMREHLRSSKQAWTYSCCCWPAPTGTQEGHSSCNRCFHRHRRLRQPEERSNLVKKLRIS
ncbi:hypothetical protein CASFOL_011915 [Castilleja foliolosa]|uniref:Uncharacterized protein n=1 Tax=Castilleja foliolosa TaxID=1961234 RepID=A0ABD3DPH3_9LAMI